MSQPLPLRGAYSSVFAGWVVLALTSASSPLLDKPYTAATKDASDDDDLRPRKPNPEQRFAYDAFCDSINTLCISPYMAPPKPKQIVYLPPSQEPTFCGWPGVLHPGGIAGLIDEMTESICSNRVAKMAELFLQTCPGDWNAGWGTSYGARLRNAAVGKAKEAVWKVEEDDDSGDLDDWDYFDVGQSVRWRWEFALLADHIVRVYDLPIPRNEMCLYWRMRQWQWEVGRSTSHDRIWSWFVGRKVFPKPTVAQGPPDFIRPSKYVSAAIAELRLPWEETEAICEKVRAFLESIKAFHHGRALNDPVTTSKGQAWLQSLGKISIREEIRDGYSGVEGSSVDHREEA